MTAIARLTTSYGSSADGVHTLRKAFVLNSDPPADALGGTTVDIGDVGSAAGGIEDIRVWLTVFYNTLSLLAKAGTTVRGAFCDIIDTESDFGTPIASQEYDVLAFTCVGSPDEWGPRGSAFVGCSQFIPATGHKGWLRWYCTSKEVGAEPKQFAASAFSPDLADNIGYLQDFGSPTALENRILSYAVFTAVPSPEGIWTLQQPPSSQMKQGIVNG